MSARFACLAVIIGNLPTTLLLPSFASMAASSASSATATVCALSIPSLTAATLQKDQAIVTARLVALSATRSTVMYAGGNCLAVAVRDGPHPRRLINAAIRVGYLADADSGTHYLAPGTHVTLDCRKNGCAPGLPAGKTTFRQGRQPTLQIVVPMKFLQRGSARVSSDSYAGPAITYSITGKGATRWCHFTTHHVNRYTAVVLDGTVLGDPIIQEPICGGQTQVTGLASREQAREIVAYINAGPLPVPLTIQSASSRKFTERLVR